MVKPVVKVADALQGVTTLALDAAPLIYFVENHPAFSGLCVPFFTAIGAGQIEAVTSTLTLAETLVVPLRNNDQTLIRTFTNVLSAAQGITMVPVSGQLAERAADLRARYHLKTPDAIQIATAIHAGCDAFLTNDGALLRVAEIPVVVLSTLTL